MRIILVRFGVTKEVNWTNKIRYIDQSRDNIVCSSPRQLFDSKDRGLEGTRSIIPEDDSTPVHVTMQF